MCKKKSLSLNPMLIASHLDMMFLKTLQGQLCCGCADWKVCNNNNNFNWKRLRREYGHVRPR